MQEAKIYVMKHFGDKIKPIMVDFLEVLNVD